MVVGRYKKSGTAKVVVTGKIGDKDERFDFPATFVEHSGDESMAFIEKLWAVRRVGEILDQIDLNGRNEELVKELVELATRHGILTPYTSFMADETTNLHDMASNAARASVAAQIRSRMTGGAAGTAQRAMKGDFQNAYQYSADNDYAPANAHPRKDGRIQRLRPRRGRQRRRRQAGSMRRHGGAEGGYGGLGGASRSDAGPPRSAAPVAEAAKASGELSYGKDVEKEAEQAQASVRNVGNRTFYRRQNQWVDSQLTAKQQQNARRVKQFSKEYFDLANRYGRTMSQYLAMDEPVMLNFDGQAYLIEP